MKKLIICEKPSLCKNVVEAIPEKSVRKNGYYETNNYYVSYAFGHLFALKDLEEYNPVTSGNKGWTLDGLPFFPENYQFRLKKDPKTKKTDPGIRQQYEVLKKLINDDDVESIIHCGDADREGEVIIRLILMNAQKKKKPVYRLWLPEQTPQTIRNSLAEMKPDFEYDNLFNEGLARTCIDWSYGINFTRLATIKAGSLMRVGRVITPIVRQIYDREMSIKNFIPVKTWRSFTDIEIDGVRLHLASSKEFAIDDKGRAESYCKKLNSVPLKVTDIIKKKEKRSPGKLFSLSNLQGVLGKKYQMSPQETLKYVQQLYEHGYVTYPRTNTEYLSENEAEKADRLVEVFQSQGLDVKRKRGKKIFDDSKIESHSALIPTEKLPASLDVKEKIVYETIRNRFLAVFCGSDCIIEKTKILLDNGLERFEISGSVIKQKGFLQFEAAPEETLLPELKIGEIFSPVFKTEIKETKPPKRYTVETLNQFLKNPFKKNDAADDDTEEYRAILAGIEIGTEATRAAIIDNAIRSGYISLRKNTYYIEPKGVAMISCMEELGIDISTETTVKISMMLKDVYKNKRTFKQVLAASKSEIEKGFSKREITLSEKSKFKDDCQDKQHPKIGKCPLCGSEIHEGEKCYYCNNKKCKFILWKNNKYFEAIGYRLTNSGAGALLRSGKVLAKGLKSKKNPEIKYDAYIVADFSKDPIAFSMEFPSRDSISRKGKKS